MKRPIKVDALANMHSHLREGQIVGPLIKNAIAGGADVLGVMPNTEAGLTTYEQVFGYIFLMKNWWAAKEVHLIPFLMITETTDASVIEKCVHNGVLDGKVYPRHRTTNSSNGVKQYGQLLQVLKVCANLGMRVHFHPEHPSLLYTNRDAEFAFLPLAEMFLNETDATIVWEHGTDARCIPHWEDFASTGRFSLTLTAHHLVTTEDRTFGDVRATCKPPIKTEGDRRGLVDLVSKNYPWVMAGGDDAFHDQAKKLVEKGRCACGAYTAPFLLPLYAQGLTELLESDGGVETFVNFTSRNARRRYDLPPTSRTVTLEREDWQVPLTYPINKQTAVPFWAGETLNWRIAQ